jgi:hypothetical protein
MKQVIPTHDPQTGELNPFYQELTGQSNPLSCKPHLIWWNELPKEKQYTLNYHYFGQPDLGETDFLTEDDIKKIWSKEVTDRIIVDYVKNGNRLHGIHNIDVIRDGGTIILESFLGHRPKFYLHKDNFTLHSSYPVSDDNLITDKPTKVYIMDCVNSLLERKKDEIKRIQSIVDKFEKNNS